ncbi:MFS transporter [Alkalibaculum bacchi]|uniref:MFS transporter n=1 Tax=Alkalibaculum bacchi TaxID=645887 RepID=A0A366IFM8_9FIRM|nr:MFS transporter [Alkalibaculum bacchi]RBP70161.1 MFS transporter [Alkalibaculum bacchi]
MNDNKKIILIISILGALWTPFITTSVNIALPHMGTYLKIGSSLVNWITSSTILAIAMFTLPMGKLSDMIGRKKLMLIGAIISTISTFMCALSQSIYFLLVFRVLQGIGCAMISTAVVSIVCAAYPPNERGKALGINAACVYIGLSAGPIIGGGILSFTSWRGIFLFPIPLGLLLIFLLIKVFRTDDIIDKSQSKFDLKGTGLYGISIFLIIFSLSNLLLRNWSKYTLILGILMLCTFVYFESKVSFPIIDIKLMKGNRVLIFSSLAALINYSSTYAISYLMSLYLQVAQWIEPGTVGLILLTQPAIQATLSPFAGRLSDKISSQVLASIGMCVITLVLFGFSLFNQNTPIALVVFLLALVGAGFAFFSSPNTNSIMSSVDKTHHGVASGILGTSRTVGQSFSMSLTALITSIFMGNEQIGTETILQFIQSFKVTFAILAFLCLLGVFASLARGKKAPMAE